MVNHVSPMQAYSQQPAPHSHPEVPGDPGLQALPSPAGSLLPGGNPCAREAPRGQGERAQLLPVCRAR